MGIYYQPPPPFMGAAQPLAPKELTPPSGPAHSNPVFGAVSLLSTVVAAWTASAQPLPPRPNFIPPPAATKPPAVQTIRPEILAAWAAVPLPLPQRILLDPPISGPAPQNPPIAGGAKIPVAVQVQWLPPQPQPITAVNLKPPIAGPTPQNPPRFIRQPAIDLAWSPGVSAAQPRSLVAALLQRPANPPYTSPAFLSLEAWWTQPAWDPQRPKYLTPPISGIAPSNPPAGNFIPEAVLIGWLPPQPQPIVAVNLKPPIAGPTPQNPPFGMRRVLALELWSTSALLPPGSRGIAPLIQIISGPPPLLNAAQLTVIEAWWSQVAPPPVLARLLNPALAPNNPPFPGAQVPQAVEFWWIPPPPSPQVAILLNPPIGGPLPSQPPLLLDPSRIARQAWDIADVRFFDRSRIATLGGGTVYVRFRPGSGTGPDSIERGVGPNSLERGTGEC